MKTFAVLFEGVFKSGELFQKTIYVNAESESMVVETINDRLAEAMKGDRCFVFGNTYLDLKQFASFSLVEVATCGSKSS